MMQHHYASPLGGITLASDGEALTGLRFDETVPGTESETPAAFEEAARWLDAYFSGREPTFTPAIRLVGSPFRRAVWDVLLTIPYGHTMTYGEVAARIGCASAQAVGGAIGHNPIALIVPCHRVIGAGGQLVGYAGGLDKKCALLTREGVCL